MDKYIDSVVSSSVDYLYNLEYLAKNDEKTLTDLFNLQILLSVWDWMDWVEYSEKDKITIENKINDVIWKNPNLEYVVNDFKYYSNVNTRQNIWDWQRVYDNLNAKTVNDL